MEWWSGDGGGEEFRLKRQEVQELSTTTPTCQLILKMNSEDQTVDLTNILMGDDHDTITV